MQTAKKGKELDQGTERGQVSSWCKVNKRGVERKLQWQQGQTTRVSNSEAWILSVMGSL